MTAIYPHFVNFTGTVTGRLTTFLNFIFDPNKQTDRVTVYRSMDCPAIVVCGLCLTQGTAEGMRKELLDVFCQEVFKAASRLFFIIVTRVDVQLAITRSQASSKFKRGGYTFLPLPARCMFGAAKSPRI